jgi:hypothetical protein
MIYHENIILGAGPAALQCAYFFNLSNIDYIIIEKNSKCGSFFDTYPLTGNLTSMNIKAPKLFYSDKEFNLRSDFNSLLTNDKFNFTEYTSEKYPNRRCMVNYLNDFKSKYNIPVIFNCNIIFIFKTNDTYILTSASKQEYSCKNLIVSTGLSIIDSWQFDKTIFKFNIELTNDKKYPKINNNFESVDHRQLYFIGTLMHSLGYKNSASQYIYGFRYLIKAFIQMNYTNFNGSFFDLVDDIGYAVFIKHILRRLATSSALFHMHGILGDMFYLNKEKKQIYYIYDVPISYYDNSNDLNIFHFILTIECETICITVFHHLTEFVKHNIELNNNTNYTVIFKLLKTYLS